VIEKYGACLARFVHLESWGVLLFVISRGTRTKDSLAVVSPQQTSRSLLESPIHASRLVKLPVLSSCVRVLFFLLAGILSSHRLGAVLRLAASNFMISPIAVNTETT
jgi:hypothetical protein